MKKILKISFIVAIIATIATTSIFAEGYSETQETKQEIKVLVFGMFEVGENEGDFAGEFQHFYENYFVDSTSYDIDGLIEPLYVNKDGVAGTIAGMGKAQAASTLTAILSYPKFDFTNTYIVISGCSGIDPNVGTLGDVVIASSLVDYELGNSWSESDNPEDADDSRFIRSTSYDNSGYFVCNEDLVQWALDITKNIELVDSEDAASYRALYNQNESVKPSIYSGISVTGDSYWHGESSAYHAQKVCEAYDADGVYTVTQMEDNAFGVVAKNFNLADKLIVIRDAVNFDRPHEGQSVTESLNSSSGAFSIGMTNGFLVSKAIIDALIEE